jgi:hypothetical protein
MVIRPNAERSRFPDPHRQDDTTGTGSSQITGRCVVISCKGTP